MSKELKQIKREHHERDLAAFFLLVVLGLGALAALVCVLPSAHAENGAVTNISENVATAYKFDRQEAAYRTAVNAADSTTIDATFLTAVPVFGVNGRQTIAVSGRFSNAGETATVCWVSIWKNPATGQSFVLGISPLVTLTASSSLKIGTKWAAPTAVFDGYGGSEGRLMVVTPPTHTVDFWVGSY